MLKKSKFNVRLLTLTAVMFSSVVLVGCGTSEPSESEMFDALKNTKLDLVRENDRADFKKAGCEKTGDKSYKCGMTSKDATMVLPFGFTKVDGKWVASPTN